MARDRLAAMRVRRAHSVEYVFLVAHDWWPAGTAGCQHWHVRTVLQLRAVIMLKRWFRKRLLPHAVPEDEPICATGRQLRQL